MSRTGIAALTILKTDEYLAFQASRRVTPAFETKEATMAIDAATVRKVARLARIAEPEERIEPLVQELNGILQWIEQLAEVDTDGVEPLTSVVHAKLPLRD